jgi:hypothetical protein
VKPANKAKQAHWLVKKGDAPNANKAEINALAGSASATFPIFVRGLF